MTARGFCGFVALIGCAASLLLTSCGGGGGGPISQQFTISGNVLWIETGGPTSPASSVRVGDTSVTTDTFDGFFEIGAPAGTTQITVTYAAGGTAQPIVRTFTFPAITSDLDLGDLYIGPEVVTIAGTVVDAGTNAPLADALVRIAGRSGTSGADGRFAVEGVAYSSSSQAVFFGLQGRVSRAGYFDRLFSPTSTPVGGVVEVGTIALSPDTGNEPPPLPFNISGNVLPAQQGAGATVELISGSEVIRVFIADSTGRFQFWAPAGAYTVRATQGAMTGTANVSLATPSEQKTVNVTIQ